MAPTASSYGDFLSYNSADHCIVKDIARKLRKMKDWSRSLIVGVSRLAHAGDPYLWVRSRKQKRRHRCDSLYAQSLEPDHNLSDNA